jgi:hypothetical protein
MDCFVAEFIIGPAEGRTRWLLAMSLGIAWVVYTSNEEAKVKQRQQAENERLAVTEAACGMSTGSNGAPVRDSGRPTGWIGQSATPSRCCAKGKSTSNSRWDIGHEDNSPENGTCRTVAGSKPLAGVANGQSTGV